MKRISVSNISRKNYLIHCITNPISITQCANAVLALWAKPVMAEHPGEVEEITKGADALLLNLGNITDVRMKSMEISFRVAIEKGIPVVIDACGVACSRLRLDFIHSLIGVRDALQKDDTGHSSSLVIKGNYSEIKALWDESYRGRGVDADYSLDTSSISKIAKKLSDKYDCTVLASGKTDVVADKNHSFFIKNGTEEMSRITGTGCMLGAICASFLAGEDDDTSYLVKDACAFFGIAGEMAKERLMSEKGSLGTGSYLVYLMDAISLMDKDTFEKRARISEE